MIVWTIYIIQDWYIEPITVYRVDVPVFIVKQCPIFSALYSSGDFIEAGIKISPLGNQIRTRIAYSN